MTWSKRSAAVALAAISAALPQAAQAHHAWFSQFDPCAPFTFSGTVEGVEWLNPHATLYVTGKGPDGRARTYSFMAGTPNTLVRTGLTRATLATGTAVTMRGYLPFEGHCWESLVTHVETCLAGGHTATIAGHTYTVGGGALVAPPPADWPKAETQTGAFMSSEPTRPIQACPVPPKESPKKP
jgi:hypothetical protein